MAEITIRLVYNLDTGKQDIYIDYESDEDALPVEHEREHREIVRQLLGQGVLDPDDVGQVRARRAASQPGPGGAATTDHREATGETM